MKISPVTKATQHLPDPPKCGNEQADAYKTLTRLLSKVLQPIRPVHGESYAPVEFVIRTKVKPDDKHHPWILPKPILLLHLDKS